MASPAVSTKLDGKKVKGYLASEPSAPLQLADIPRQAPSDEDVTIRIAYCGVCHTDLSVWKNEIGISPFPLCPGHEITGYVEAVGKNVTKFKPGDRVGVGTIVDSCRNCSWCHQHEENLCENGASFTYGFPDQRIEGGVRYGGYSSTFVIPERYVLSIPDSLDLAATAPLLCAGITVFLPLYEYGVKGSKTGVIGIGGLGHLAIKLARALDHYVVAFTTSEAKKESLLALGAHEVVVTTNPDNFKAVAGKLDLLVDTVSGPHDLSAYSNTLKPKGRFHIVGLIGQTLQVPYFPTMMKQWSWSSSPVGGIGLTQKMLDLAGKHNIVSEIELVHLKDWKTVFERLEKGDVRYRFVFDIENDLKQA